MDIIAFFGKKRTFTFARRTAEIASLRALFVLGGILLFVPSAEAQTRSPQTSSHYASALPDEIFEKETLPRKRIGIIFNRPSEESSAAQKESAEKLFAGKNFKAACRAANALVSRWPYSEEAAAAQLLLAESFSCRGKYNRAFDEYEYLLKYYPDSISAAEISARMKAIADMYFTRKKYSAALKLYLRLQPQTPEIELLTGDCQKKLGEPFEAIVTYERLATPEALSRAAITLWELSKKRPRNDALSLRAIAALHRAILVGGESKELTDALEEVCLRRCEAQYQIAKFYDSPTRPKSAARTAYEQFIKNFPNTPQSAAAAKRLEELSQN